MSCRVSEPEWIAELHFRANGPERAGGNLQLWYVKDGESQIGATSIYTVGQFDGLVLAIDTHGGRVRCFIAFVTFDFPTLTLSSGRESSRVFERRIDRL